MPNLKNKNEGILGLLDIYRKFHFARVTKPLTLYLKKDTKIILTPKFIKKFEYGKNILSNISYNITTFWNHYV